MHLVVIRMKMSFYSDRDVWNNQRSETTEEKTHFPVLGHHGDEVNCSVEVKLHVSATKVLFA